jgi:hypothetical protein
MKMARCHSGRAKCYSLVSTHDSKTPAVPYQSYGDWHYRPEHIHGHRHPARAPKADSEELEWMYALPPALALRRNALGDLMAVVVEAREVHAIVVLT